MERQESARNRICPDCGLSFKTGKIGNFVFYTCCSCQSYYVNLPNIPAPEQLEMVKYFVRDLRKALKTEQRRKEELERQHVEKLISQREVLETVGNRA